MFSESDASSSPNCSHRGAKFARMPQRFRAGRTRLDPVVSAGSGVRHRGASSRCVFTWKSGAGGQLQSTGQHLIFPIKASIVRSLAPDRKRQLRPAPPPQSTTRARSSSHHRGSRARLSYSGPIYATQGARIASFMPCTIFLSAGTRVASTPPSFGRAASPSPLTK